MSGTIRNLILILGDQLDKDNAALLAGDPRKDALLFVECRQEASHVSSHKHRTVLFLSAMRHFAAAQKDKGWTVYYFDLTQELGTIAEGIETILETNRVDHLWAVEPGEWRLKAALTSLADDRDLPLQLFDDTHFLVDHDQFEAWAKGRKQLTMEYFYREQRKRLDILMDDNEPQGGAWNFDEDNRKSFPKSGPPDLPAIPKFTPNDITKDVIAAVDKYFPDHPGRTDNFFWPVTREQALQALGSFIDERLPNYGRYQDAMWQSEPFLFHALISSAINIKLLNPREVTEQVVAAFNNDENDLPIAAVEGFVRQIIGWREFIRGVYWLKMPDYKSLNHFGHEQPLPDWFWTGETEMNCLRQSIGDTLENGYAHHIQRLMIIGNYATLAHLSPQAVCDWYLGIYVDAVEWVELPNTLGMALHADGGIVGSKPYVASGSYINRMSNYCGNCKFNVKERVSENACPFNSLYWDFMQTYRETFGKSPRMSMVLKNLDRWDKQHVTAIQQRAAALRDN